MFRHLVSLLPDTIPLFGGATPVHSSAEGQRGGLPSLAVMGGAALRVPPFAEDTLLTLERALGLALRAGPVCSRRRKRRPAFIPHPHQQRVRTPAPPACPAPVCLSDDSPPGSAQRHLAGSGLDVPGDWWPEHCFRGQALPTRWGKIPSRTSGYLC